MLPRQCLAAVGKYTALGGSDVMPSIGFSTLDWDYNRGKSIGMAIVIGGPNYTGAHPIQVAALLIPQLCSDISHTGSEAWATGSCVWCHAWCRSLHENILSSHTRATGESQP